MQEGKKVDESDCRHSMSPVKGGSMGQSDLSLNVEGMKCVKCAAAVEKALKAVPGVEDAEVSLENRIAHIKGQADKKALIAAVVEAGFEASLKK